MGSQESTLEGIGILSVVVLPCGMMVYKFFNWIVGWVFWSKADPIPSQVDTGLNFQSIGAV